MIDHDAIGVYLNDHLAGSVAALEIMERVCGAQANSHLATELAELKQAVESDQEILRELIAAYGKSESTLAKTLGWMGEKVSRAKNSLNRGDEDDLMLFEALEILALGFHGRLALWNLLATLQGDLQDGHDFPVLAIRVREQIGRLERFRLHAGRIALTAQELSRAHV
jgi:hypothetical protein